MANLLYGESSKVTYTLSGNTIRIKSSIYSKIRLVLLANLINIMLIGIIQINVDELVILCYLIGTSILTFLFTKEIIFDPVDKSIKVLYRIVVQFKSICIKFSDVKDIELHEYKDTIHGSRLPMLITKFKLSIVCNNGNKFYVDVTSNEDEIHTIYKNIKEIVQG